jgi:hypothetical protein
MGGSSQRIVGRAKREPILSRIYVQTTFYSGVLSTSFMIAEVIRVASSLYVFVTNYSTPNNNLTGK